MYSENSLLKVETGEANSSPEYLEPEKDFSKKAFPVGVHSGSHTSARQC